MTAPAPSPFRRQMVAQFGAIVLAGCALPARQAVLAPEIGFVDIRPGLALRRMTVRAERPRGTVLLLHGFPETLLGWMTVALALGTDHEVHGFDWPGYGLSSRPPVDQFTYAPLDYAGVLKDYIARAGIDRARLTIYATDTGALPALLLALEEPDTASRIIVGDFAPFDRPHFMQATLQSLKSPATAGATRAVMNANRNEILENAFRRGLQAAEQFELSPEFRDDMRRGWDHPSLTTADAFFHYYSHFTRDQVHFEQHLARLRTPVEVVWGEKDFYISPGMGTEFATRANLPFRMLTQLGHYPHLQDPQGTVNHIRGAVNRSRT
ncbi:MAG TPA: alpha/beta hydrolase [Lautropia sp.]|nr:alpha/beta hydrolase [Lautropia sp.]